MLCPQRAGRHQAHAGLSNHFTQRHKLLGLAPVLIVLREVQAAAAKNPGDLHTSLLAIIANVA